VSRDRELHLLAGFRYGSAFCLLWERRKPRSRIPFAAWVSLLKQQLPPAAHAGHFLLL